MKTDELTAHDKSFMRLSVENSKLREKVEKLRAALELSRGRLLEASGWMSQAHKDLKKHNAESWECPYIIKEFDFEDYAAEISKALEETGEL